MSGHPVPNPPVRPAGPAQVHTARSMKLVDNTVCKVGCQEHAHVQPVFRPDPQLDETGVGWTAQHIPTDTSRHIVAKKCIFCWEQTDDMSAHVCRVLEVVNG